jgi:hypothetical protein
VKSDSENGKFGISAARNRTVNKFSSGKTEKNCNGSFRNGLIGIWLSEMNVVLLPFSQKKLNENVENYV